MKKTLILVMALAIGLMVAQVAPAGSIITAVDRSRGTAGDRSPIGVFDQDTDPLASNPMADGQLVFSDRDYPWIATPAGMVGNEYVRTFNTDKDDDNHILNYDVTTSELAVLWIAVDDRWADVSSSGGVQEYVSQQEMVDLAVPFVAPGTFLDTGIDLTIDEGGGRPMSVYSAELPAGTYRFSAMPIDKNFYIIGAVPEPMTLALLGLGGLGLVRRRRR